MALAVTAPLTAAAQQAPSPSPAAGSTVSEIVVTAKRLNAARAAIQPALGASVYTIDSKAIAALPGGDNLELNQVVLQSPGVAQDSFGQLHVRGEHNGLQFRLNGVILPEGLSVFSQALSPRLADKVQLITGALPAQYGLRTAGIIDIGTKDGVTGTSGDVSIYGGSHDQIQPSFEVGGGGGSFNYFVSGSYLHSAWASSRRTAAPPRCTTRPTSSKASPTSKTFSIPRPRSPSFWVRPISVFRSRI